MRQDQSAAWSLLYLIPEVSQITTQACLSPILHLGNSTTSIAEEQVNRELVLDDFHVEEMWTQSPPEEISIDDEHIGLNPIFLEHLRDPP